MLRVDRCGWDTEVVKSYKPERVFLACGGVPIAPQAFLENDHPNVKLWNDVIDHCADINNQKIAIIGGGVTGLELGDELTQEGKGNHVTIVEMLSSFGGTVSPMISGVLVGALQGEVRGSAQSRVVSPDQKIDCVHEGEEIHIDAV